MRIEYLEYIISFYETRSVTVTAARFFMSTQGMSRALHQLEKEQGAALFESEGGYTQFTKAGEVFVESARSVVEAYYQLEKRMNAFAGVAGAPGLPVRVVSTPAAMLYLTPFLDLQRPGKFPFEVFVREESLGDYVSTLKTITERRTLGVVSLPSKEVFLRLVSTAIEEEGLIYEPLIRTRIVALVSSVSRYAKKGEFNLRSDIEDASFGFFNDEVLLNLVDDYAREDAIKIVTNNLSALFDQVADGRIVSFISNSYLAASALPAGVVAVPVMRPSFVEFGFLCKKESAEDDEVVKLQRYIRGFLHNNALREPFKELYTFIG